MPASERRVRAALIDLDGTLLATLPDLAHAAQAALRELGLPDVPQAKVEVFVGRGVRNLVRCCLEFSSGKAPDTAQLERALARFEAHYADCNGKESKPYPGVIEGLQKMRADGLLLACVTNKAARFTHPLLAATGLAEFFGVVVTPENAPRPKPHPDPYLEACRLLGTSAAESVVIGDSAIDGESARKAGCRYFLVPYGYREGAALRDVESDGIVATLLQAAILLQSTRE